VCVNVKSPLKIYNLNSAKASLSYHHTKSENVFIHNHLPYERKMRSTIKRPIQFVEQDNALPPFSAVGTRLDLWDWRLAGGDGDKVFCFSNDSCD